jgi:hypothetical protein
MNIANIVMQLVKELDSAERYAGKSFEVSGIADLPDVSYTLCITLTRAGEPDFHELLVAAEAKI